MKLKAEELAMPMQFSNNKERKKRKEKELVIFAPFICTGSFVTLLSLLPPPHLLFSLYLKSLPPSFPPSLPNSLPPFLSDICSV